MKKSNNSSNVIKYIVNIIKPKKTNKYFEENGQLKNYTGWVYKNE